MRKIIVFSIALCMVGCGSKPDTVSADAELMLLLDTLYQHVRTDSFPSKVRTEEKWMSDYRSRLSAYYDSHSLGSDTISIYAKADSVLNKGKWLLELGSQWSTTEMVVYNSTVFTFDRYREYGLLTQVINSCENERAKELVYQEWALYEQMLTKIGPIASNLVCLDYWGGSITGPLSTSIYLKILQTRIDMYQTILDIMKGDGWDSTGVYLSNAERFFFDCCATSVKRIDEISKENEGKDPESGYYETIEKTKVAIQELRPLVNEWISLLNKVDEELTHDGSRHSVERAASYMLMKWANLVQS